MGKSTQTSAGYDYPPPVQTNWQDKKFSHHHWPPFYKHNTDLSL